MEDYIGMIKMFAGNYAPKDYLLCDGKILSIKQYQALFGVLGFTYGGDGKDTFKLPDLRGRMIVGVGTGKTDLTNPNSDNLTARSRGNSGGVEKVVLGAEHIPKHTHTYNALTGDRENKEPNNNFLGKTVSVFYASKGATDQLVPMASGAVSQAGEGLGHENMPPFLTINYIICIRGIYPTRP